MRVKNKATEFLKEEKYEMAIKLYTRAKEYRITSKCFDSSSLFLLFLPINSIVNICLHLVDGAKNEFQTGVMLNIAMCQMKLEDYMDAKRTVSWVFTTEIFECIWFSF